MENTDLWGIGIQNLQTYNIPKLKAYLFGKDNGQETGEAGNEPSLAWDLRGVTDEDPDNIEDVELCEQREEMESIFAVEIQRRKAAERLEVLRRQAEASGVIVTR